MKKIFSYAVLSALLFLNSSVYAVTSYSIGQVNHTNSSTGVADSLNKRYQLSGTVYGGNFAASGKLSFFISDGTGSIQVFSSHSYGYTPTEGDAIVVVGSLTQYGGAADCGQLEIKASATTTGDTVYKTGTGTLMMPEIITALDEAHESHLVRINGLTLSFPTDWTNSATGFSVRTTQNIKVYMNKYTNAIAVASPGATAFDIIGLESQYDTSAPYTAYYSVSPRYATDVITYTGVAEVSANPMRVIAFPNPASVTLTLSFMAEQSSAGTLTITDITGRKVSTESLFVLDGENRKEISLEGYANGLYLARLAAGTKESVVKFTVVK